MTPTKTTAELIAEAERLGNGVHAESYLYELIDRLAQALRESEAGAAVMLSALVAVEKSHPFWLPRTASVEFGGEIHALHVLRNRVLHAISSTTAGSELLAEREKLRTHAQTLFSRLKAAHSFASQEQHFTQYDSFATEEAISKFIREFPQE